MRKSNRAKQKTEAEQQTEQEQKGTEQESVSDRLPRDNREIKSGKILDSLEGVVDDMDDVVNIVENELESSTPQAEDSEEKEFDPAAITVKNSKLLFAAGILVIIMTIVGLVTTVRAGIEITDRLINQTALKEQFAEFLYPVVLTDTPAFTTVAEAPPSIIISSAIWRIVLSGNTDKYENDGTTMTVSEIDVESAAAALFGFGIELEHQSVGFGESAFTYSSSSKSYSVPMAVSRYTYWPRVSEMSNVGELFTLKVEYMEPLTGVGGIDLNKEEAVKAMIYTVSRTSTAMTIKSVAYNETTTLQEQYG